MLQGPNWDSLAEMRAAIDQPLIASGGVQGADDVRRLAPWGWTESSSVGPSTKESLTLAAHSPPPTQFRIPRGNHA